jgi:hypothetical protein
VVFAGFARQAGAAFVNSTAGNRESGYPFAGTVRGLPGQVSVNDRCVHIYSLIGLVVVLGLIRRRIMRFIDMIFMPLVAWILQDCDLIRRQQRLDLL